MRYIALVLAVQAGVAGAGQMYVCTDAEGKKSFQAMPCAGAAKAEVRAYESAPVSRVGADWAVLQQLDRMTSEQLCFLTSRMVSVSLPHTQWAGLSLAISRHAGQDIVSLISRPSGSEVSKNFNPRSPVEVKVGDLDVLRPVTVSGDAAMFDDAASGLIINALRSGASSALYRAAFWPYDNRVTVDASLSGFSAKYDEFIACEEERVKR